ncbi:MAG: FAD-dependent oxidoreductase [Proteobacteria bacterium]|nr:FAD-dependent oxidoreductase [Pseudomonadota bacterium]
MTPQRIAIAGAGVLGRLAAWQLARAGHQVSVFDPAPGPQPPATGALARSAPYAAGFTAAGMLSPIAELDGAGPEVARLGWRALALWRGICDAINPNLMRQHGSLLLAHGSDLGAAQRVLARLTEAPELPAPQPLNAAALHELEPALVPHLHAWLLPGEGQVLPRELLAALVADAPGVDWQWGRSVQTVTPGRLTLEDGSLHTADWALDLRGLGARPASPLRGVRGEVVWLHAPGVALARPLRLAHPRHRVYVVPRPGDFIVIGASEIESEDRSPVSLRSAVELMAAAHSVLPELAEARIVHMEANLRPALPDNHPRTEVQPGRVAINGLFRHGWLLAPALLADALAAADLLPS